MLDLHENVRYSWDENISTKVKDKLLSLFITISLPSLPLDRYHQLFIAGYQTIAAIAILLEIFLKKYIILSEMLVLTEHKNYLFLNIIYKISKNSVCIPNAFKCHA